MSEAKLINAVVVAIQREDTARGNMRKAEQEHSDASSSLRDAWTALREYQDAQVQAALEKADNL